jgi:hypothetical protein
MPPERERRDSLPDGGLFLIQRTKLAISKPTPFNQHASRQKRQLERLATKKQA